jgi:hypothetical protein
VPGGDDAADGQAGRGGCPEMAEQASWIGRSSGCVLVVHWATETVGQCENFAQRRARSSGGVPPE